MSKVSSLAQTYKEKQLYLRINLNEGVLAMQALRLTLKIIMAFFWSFIAVIYAALALPMLIIEYVSKKPIPLSLQAQEGEVYQQS